MEIFTELATTDGLSLALGYFDGVHIGHEKVIQSAVNFANKFDCKSAVITFEDHPCCTLWDVGPKYILQKEKRIEYIQSLGIDYLFLLDFAKMKNLTGEDYIKQILVKNFSPRCIVTGFNHYFGAGKSGDTDLLEKNSTLYGYKYIKIPSEKFEDEIISSTAIRNYLQGGNIVSANKMLGHEFSISGEVVEGNKIGRTIGFPTANINYPQQLIDIPLGAYKTVTKVNNIEYKSITNCGIKPTVSVGNSPVLETHLINFEEDLYGQNIEVKFLQFLRPEQKFSSLGELKNQINIDLQSVL